MLDRHYLELLAKEYPTAAAVSAEIINLSAICQLPKGTEYFFSDIHGEAEAFCYLLGTASGVINGKIEALFLNSLSEPERMLLGHLIYQPETVLDTQRKTKNYDEWCRITIFRLVQVCKNVAGKYTRSKVRKKMPTQFAYAMDELLHAGAEESKEDYYTTITEAIIATGMAEQFIIALCQLIKRSAIDVLHIVGDVYDRGPHPDEVMEELMSYTNVDIQWGNHDIHWMAAAAGSELCVANVVRIAVSYNNFDLLEDSYGINLRPLSSFAAEVYRDDACEFFRPHILDDNLYDMVDEDLAAKMHKAIAVIMFKLEGQLYARNPEFGMDGRALLTRVDFAKGELDVAGKRYPMRDTMFPTVNPKDPLALTDEEAALVHTLTRSFTHSPRLQEHIRFLYNNGSLYKIANGNLLYHGCIPMEEDGSFSTITVRKKDYSGKTWLDFIDEQIREVYFAPKASKQRRAATDFMWYLWCGAKSPLFGKHCITTFERYFVADKEAHVEVTNPYYTHIKTRAGCERILHEFGLSPEASRIVNGHVPVKLPHGENPVKGDGLLFVIDGGISKSYHGRTGIGGYTLISNSHNLALAQHRPFAEIRNSGFSIGPKVQLVERFPRRVRVRDTDTGARLLQDIEELKQLLAAYREGDLQEKR
ncbi:fructose-1,6-bisphosphatase [Ruminococcaceae bacterium OttesenSCG-928-O06]|nr:fructose-1,6-bisphosphatase [Ruminococcaceae bacterium OttesenSCG-928-O06]